MSVSRETYQKCWAILVEHAGAQAEDEERFLQYAEENPEYIEYRFCGVLGFGGKFRHYRGHLYVDCYPESMTPERREVIEKVNALLKEVKREAEAAG